MNRQVYRKELLLKSYINVSETERKAFQEVSPKKNMNITISILVILFILSILCLFSARHQMHLHDRVFYALLLIVFLGAGWRISLLKTVLLQTSRNKLIVKYINPLLSKQEPPVLEISLNKLESFTIIREFFVCYLVINRRSGVKKQVKSFYFRLGFLSRKQVATIRETLDTICEHTYG